MRSLLVAFLLLAACGDDGGLNPDVDASPPGDGGACDRSPAAPDRPRKVVVSHPYDAAGDPAATYRVLDLGVDGALADPGVTFELGRATIGEIAFTPDGEVGLVAQEDGTLGVFRFDGDTPVVVHAAFAGAFYAARVVMDPGGEVAYVLDTQWRENGGGVYRVAIACDGTLTDLGRWLPSKLPAALHLRGTRAVLAAADVDGSTAGQDAYLLDWTADPPELLAGADAFGDDEAIVAGTAVVGNLFLIGDNSAFSSVPNRIAAVSIDAQLAPVQVITPLEDPIALVASPHDDVVLAVSGFGDAIHILDHDATQDPPLTLRGEVAYAGAAPQLPGTGVVVERGALAGLALVAEVDGLRRIRMSGGGSVTDLGLTSLGGGTEGIAGALGVQP